MEENNGYVIDWYSMSSEEVPSVTTPTFGGLLSIVTPSETALIQRSAVLHAVTVVKKVNPEPICT